jgi:predicted nuclease of predicted toxin-antitoxin system
LKKRSAAKPPEKIVFFIDRSLGKRDVPDALRAAGHGCECHDDHWDQNTPDSTWLAGVAARNWVVLTKDERIRYRPLELQALRAAHLRVFIVICGNVRGVETAKILLDAMRLIHAALRTRRGPFIYYVYKDSNIKEARL